jgi:hypothetical protein
MKRAGEPEEMANCYAFLACDDSSCMTGQALHPNGGKLSMAEHKRLQSEMCERKTESIVVCKTGEKDTAVPASRFRVPAHTPEAINQRIRRKTEENIAFYGSAGNKAITLRLEELDREWDIERVLEANAASVGLLGLALGAFINRKWFALPAVVSGFLLQHAIQGWCPPISLFRRLRIRTRDEIDYERYALKLLRGDFKEAPQEEVLTLSEANQLLKATER